MTDIPAESEPPLAPAEPLPPEAQAAALSPVDPDYRNVLRVLTLAFAVPFVIGALVLKGAFAGGQGYVSGSLLGPVVGLALIALLTLPTRRWRRWGYALDDIEMRVARGHFWRVDTIVPLVRVQHIDVAEGPLERLFGLATLVVHTAGTHNSTVSLPGLRPETARAMRERIRAHIQAEA